MPTELKEPTVSREQAVAAAKRILKICGGPEVVLAAGADEFSYPHCAAIVAKYILHPAPPAEAFDARAFVVKCRNAFVNTSAYFDPNALAGTIDELAAELSALIAAQGRAGDVWLPIETVPKDGTEVIIYDSGADLMWIGEWIEGCNGWSDGTGWRSKATHWMPLPAIPSPTPATE